MNSFIQSGFYRMNTPKPPKIISDIKASRVRTACGRDGFESGRRLNLSFEKIKIISLSKFSKAILLLGALTFLILGSAVAPTSNLTRAADNTQERQALESQLKDLENQINQYQDQISSYQKQGSTLSGEIGTLNAKISSLNLQVKAINLTLAQLDQNISDTQSQINITETNITNNKESLSNLLQNIYTSESTTPVEMLLASQRLSDFFGDLNDLALVQGSLRNTIEQIISLKTKLEDQKQQFALSKADTEAVKAYQTAQAAKAEQVKAEKNQLLVETKGQENKYQTLLKQTKETAAQIRNRIFQLLGGGQLTFEQAYEYAKLAGGATGINPAMILAVLDRESALGKNVGQCSYQTAMSPSNQTIFLDILNELKISPDSVTVSCPNSDGVYGGAMGPAQFIPSTWELYASGVSKITGDNPANPWNNSNAFVATALYLKDAMVGCQSIYSSLISQERCTAAKYYAGNRWHNYLFTYGEAVVSQTQNFEEDIKTITG